MNNPSSALRRLQVGNQRFYGAERSKERFADEQQPVAAVFRCADADTPSEVLLGQSWGSLIDISTWGHVIDTGVLATLEYAVGTLKTPLIVVLGHAHCAAMQTSLEAWNSASFPQGATRSVIEHAISSLTRLDGTITNADDLSAAHVVHTGASLLHKSPLVAGAVDSGDTAIVCMMGGGKDGLVRTCAAFGDVLAGDAPLLECV